MADFKAVAADYLARLKRIYTVTAPEADAEEKAINAMAEVLACFDEAQSGTGAVTSATIGSVSVSYGAAAPVDLSPRAQEQELLRCARLYLDIYRGMG